MNLGLPLNEALIDSAKDRVLKLSKKLMQKEWCTAKHLQALLSTDINAAAQGLSTVLCLKGLEPHDLKDFIKIGVTVTINDLEKVISVLSDENIDLIKVLTSEVKGSPDYAGLWYQTIKDKPVLARHFFICWAQCEAKTELHSKGTGEFNWMCDFVAKNCNSHDRTNLVKKAVEKGDGHFTDQLLLGGPVIVNNIDPILILSCLAQPVLKSSVASSILTHLLENGISFKGTCDRGLNPIECVLMDKRSDSSKKASFLNILLTNGCSIDGLDLESMQSTAIHEITKISLETGEQI